MKTLDIKNKIWYNTYVINKHSFNERRNKMKKIRVLSIFLLAICLSLVFIGCKETSKYDIKEVKNAKNVVINKKETKVSFDVDNIVSEFNPSNIVISKAKAVVYTDKDCSKEAEVPLKLVEGKNKFYFSL